MSKLPLDSNYELEQQFVLRMPQEAASVLSNDIDSGISFRDNFTIEFKNDMRHSIVRYNGQVYNGQIVDLPCIVESMKTTDKKTFYKTADISQLMICSQDERSGPIKGTAAYLDDQSNKAMVNAQKENREFQFLHGMTPPLKNVLNRRFRKTRRKRFIDMPKIESEVKKLLRADMQAEAVKWELVWSEPPPVKSSGVAYGAGAEDSQSKMGPLDDSAAGNGDGKQRVGGADDDLDEDDSRRFPVDRKDLFGGEISSSSSSGGHSSSAESSSAATSEEEDNGTATAAASDSTATAPRKHKDTKPSLHPGPEGEEVELDSLALELNLSDSDQEDQQQHSGAQKSSRQHGAHSHLQAEVSEGAGGHVSSGDDDDEEEEADAEEDDDDDNETDPEQMAAAAQVVAVDPMIDEDTVTSATMMQPDDSVVFPPDDDDEDVVFSHDVDVDDPYAQVIHKGGELLDTHDDHALMEYPPSYDPG